MSEQVLLEYIRRLERRLARLEGQEGGGATDHGGLTGLVDDDHTQYLLASAAGGRSAFGTNWTDLTDGGNTTLHGHAAYIGITNAFWTDLTDNGETQLHTHDHGLLNGLTDDDHAQYLLAATYGGRTTFGTNWTDLTDGGATTLHKHDHGGQDGLGDDDHTQYLLASGTRSAAQSGPQLFTNAVFASGGIIGSNSANGDLTINGTSDAGKTTSYVLIQPSGGKVGIGLSTPANELDVTGAVSSSGDMVPLGVRYGLGHRTINRGLTPDSHFSSATIPTGYAWAGAPFEGTPTYYVYNSLSDYLQVTAAAAGGRAFLYRNVTNAAGNWQNKLLIGRFGTGATTEIGLRIDAGNDNSYAEIYMTGALGNGMQRLDFRHRTGGGAITTVNSAVIVPCSGFMTLQLYCYYVAPNYFIGGYMLNEMGGAINITGFTQTATSFLPAAGRAGIFCKESGNYGACDWLKSEFA